VGANPDKNDGAQEASGIGRISFGYFLWQKIAPAFSAFAISMWLSAQRKVSRPPVREPALK
jgi:hypothetical protein